MKNITVTDMETKQVLQNIYADRIIGFTDAVRNADGVKISDAGVLVVGRFSTDGQVELLANGIAGLFDELERQTRISKTVLKMLLHAKIEMVDEEKDGGDGDDHAG